MTPKMFHFFHMSIQNTQGKGVGGEELDGHQFTKLGENTNMTDCISSLKTDKHLPQIPCTGQFFR